MEGSEGAERAGMSMKEYVIGGMDRGFKLKLFRALRALDEAGLAPGITSAFRDNYRQSIASGLKAATDRSYHGGSLRGGDRCTDGGRSRERQGRDTWAALDFKRNLVEMDRCPRPGVWGRAPVYTLDPPHVAPTDGKEYTDRRPAVKVQHAKSKITDPRPKPETQSRDGLTILSARRLHLRLRKCWCTPTDAMCQEKCQETA